ncbi:MAG: alpha/beta hydrolase [Psychrobium sp.]
MTIDAIVKNPQSAADAVVIWLHGLGDSGAGFSEVVPVLKLDSDHKIKFIFPNAPEQAVTINNGFVMRSWYDIKTMDLDGRADIPTLEQSEHLIVELIEEQIAAGIKPSRIVLAGFSQGGVLSLYTALRLKHKLAGVVALSCYLAHNDLPFEGAQGVNKDTPIFSSHGEQDTVVPFAAGKDAAQRLSAANFDVTFSQYPMEHSVCIPQLEKLGRWISDKLA